jgi:hypothetical protein
MADVANFFSAKAECAESTYTVIDNVISDVVDQRIAAENPRGRCVQATSHADDAAVTIGLT